MPATASSACQISRVAEDEQHVVVRPAEGEVGDAGSHDLADQLAVGVKTCTPVADEV